MKRSCWLGWVLVLVGWGASRGVGGGLGLILFWVWVKQTGVADIRLGQAPPLYTHKQTKHPYPRLSQRTHLDRHLLRPGLAVRLALHEDELGDARPVPAEAHGDGPRRLVQAAPAMLVVWWLGSGGQSTVG